MIVGARLTPTAEKVRRLMHYGQILQSHALHFFHLGLARPAVRLRCRAGAPQRGGADRRAAELAKKGVLLRKYGQE